MLQSMNGGQVQCLQKEGREGRFYHIVWCRCGTEFSRGTFLSLQGSTPVLFIARSCSRCYGCSALSPWPPRSSSGGQSPTPQGCPASNRTSLWLQALSGHRNLCQGQLGVSGSSYPHPLNPQHRWIYLLLLLCNRQPQLQ